MTWPYFTPRLQPRKQFYTRLGGSYIFYLSSHSRTCQPWKLFCVLLIVSMSLFLLHFKALLHQLTCIFGNICAQKCPLSAFFFFACYKLRKGAVDYRPSQTFANVQLFAKLIIFNFWLLGIFDLLIELLFNILLELGFWNVCTPLVMKLFMLSVYIPLLHLFALSWQYTYLVCVGF